MKPAKLDTGYSVPPVERAIALLRYIGNGNRGRNISKTSKELGINRTTLIRLIHTLLSSRMIEEIEEGAGYRLGPGLIGLAAQAIHSRDIVRVTQPILETLSAETGLSAHMGILDGRDIVYLAREAPNTHLVSNMHAGSRLPAHASSIGRAILSEMPEDDIRKLFQGHTLTALTDKTPVSVDQLLEQAHQDQELGYAWSSGNFERGIGSCGAAILDHSGAPAGGLNVSGPQELFADSKNEDADRVRESVVKAARDASIALGFTGSRWLHSQQDS
ncbi:IclR family transcriptional regulator [Shimia sediminis]|uniref:IclR family transcriptional regulator n=1 Tax=Shimia sediminis TaxID=2497945 RepID=UPI000F8E5F50|nr:IclR family transcriptional regulator [Shimia sediminis]